MRVNLSLLVLLLGFSLNYSQTLTDTPQNVELPDFVITGVEVADVPIIPKSKPDFVSSISTDFITPSYSPEMFQIGEISGPYKKDFGRFEFTNPYKSNLFIGMGTQTQPKGSFTFATDLPSGLFLGKAWAYRERDYQPNAGMNNFGLYLGSDFYIGDASTSIKSIKIKAFGKYERDIYKFFASTEPTFERINHKVDAGISVENYYNSLFNYDIDMKGGMFSLSDSSFNEKYFDVNGFAQFLTGPLTIKGNINYKAQYPENNFSGIGSYDLFTASGSAKFDFSNLLNISIGAIYSHFGSTDFLRPTASFSFKFNKYISIFGEFNPYVEFLTVKDLIKINPYLDLKNFDNSFQRMNNNIKAAFRYQYDKYFEINAGIIYSDISDYAYFTEIVDSVNFGRYSLNRTDAREMGIFTNFLFHTGPNGTFYGSGKFGEVSHSNDNIVPFAPQLTASLAYAYDFNFGLRVEPRLRYSSYSYADIANSDEVPAYIDLAFLAGYSVMNNLELNAEVHNILDNENYFYKNYLLKPLDVIFGITYRW